jgi:glycosyltransferase involved in cell wall biosynthesis
MEGAHLGALVSILINNYNYGRFVGEAIESALAQSYANCEVIVVDDGSTDDSRETIKRFADKVVPVFKGNGGQSSAFNAGFSHSRGDIICFLDSDDLFLPTKVERVVRALDGQPREWCFHHLQWTDQDLNSLEMPVNSHKSGERDERLDLCAGRFNFIPPATSGLASTRKLLDQIMPMPEEIKITSDDYLKLSSMALAPGYYLEDQLALQRIHGANAYTRHENVALKAEIQIATAFGLRRRCPVLKQVCNRMYADGLALRFRDWPTLGRINSGKSDYFEGLSLIERVAVCARVGYKVAQHSFKQRVKAPA